MKLYGKNPVLERIKSNPKSIRKILVQEDSPELGYLRLKAKKWNIPIFSVDKFKMQRLGPNQNTQGIIMEVDDFFYMPYDELLEESFKNNTTPVFLDGLNDPQNLGGIMRSLACLGGFAVVLPKHSSVEVTESVLRVASGGDNHIKTSQVSNLGNAIIAAKKMGFWMTGGVAHGGENLCDAALSFPLGLVIGSEQKGIRDIIKKHLDLALTIPMVPERMSLNVAHAATVFAYEISRQKNQTRRPR